ncbi:HAD family phosphatase [Salinimonas marina]|uniref:HAD family phosphatase n=1 Tax=Salinimonas marina TaxID=2785918 RepID=A0A7S9DXW9_9ALTE|nr:HAD family phosphatase [Salinimonas marina]QPG05290.1 HAD family phosphatase [Salinimonas marina]
MHATSGFTQHTKVVLFDHDGTLIDSEQVHFTLWQHVLSRFDIVLEQTFYNDVMAGMPELQNAHDIMREFQPDTDAASLTAAKNAALDEYLQQQPFPLMPGAIDAVLRCQRAGLVLGIVTGGGRHSLRRTLQRPELQGVFRVTVAAEDVPESKPNPQCYLQALHKLGVTAGQAVAVEDTMYGLQAASSAGIACAVIPTEHSQDHDFSLASGRFTRLAQWLDKAGVPG